MKKQAKQLKVGDTVLVAGEELLLMEVETSDIGKQGTKKARLVLKKKNDELVTLVRPEDYPFEVK